MNGRIRTLIEDLLTGKPDEVVVADLNRLKNNELADLRRFGHLLVHMADETFADNALPASMYPHPHTWRGKCDALGLRVIRNDDIAFSNSPETMGLGRTLVVVDEDFTQGRDFGDENDAE